MKIVRTAMNVKPRVESLAEAQTKWQHELSVAFPKDREYMQHWKLFHVVLEGPLGFNYDGYIPASTAEKARLAALELACSLRPNDFNSEAEEVPAQ